MEDISHKLTHFFETHLPITQHMGMAVEHYDGATLTLSAPLEPNINDKQTAFGGSLFNLAVMACWGMVYLKTQEAGIVCNQVVMQSNIKYFSPVTGTIKATCVCPGEQELNEFLERFNTIGKSKISLGAYVKCSGKTAVEFEGQYAILKETS